MFGDRFKSTIVLVGTLTHYLISLMISNLLFIVSLVIVHNILFQLSEFITDHTKSRTQVFHIASLFGVSNILSYFWADIRLAIFFAGIATVISGALYCVG